MKYDWVYRIYILTKYDVLAEIRENRLGILWKFLHPAVQIMTYWFLFEVVLDKRQINGVPYFPWMLCGMSAWLFISPGITDGCNAISRKAELVSKTKFPIWILCVSSTLQKWIDHLIIFGITIGCILGFGFIPSIQWWGVLYYMFCGFLFVTAISFVTSVFTVMAKDTRKCILALMRMYLYVTPVLWDVRLLRDPLLGRLVRMNPVYYIVEGYRESLFYQGEFLYDPFSMGCFFAVLFVILMMGIYVMKVFRKRMWELR